LRKISIQTGIDKDTGIGHHDKEQNLLKRDIEKPDTAEIIRIKIPNPIFRENDIPDNEKSCSDEYGREQESETPEKCHLLIETQDKRTKESKEVERQINREIFHFSVVELPRLK
jgi:hypothetical protein